MKSLKAFLKFALLEKEGRINRSAYIVAFCLLYTFIATLLLGSYSLYLLAPDSTIVSLSYIIFTVAVMLLQLYYSYNLNLKRSYDINKSKKLAIFVTFANAIFAICALSFSLITLLFKTFPTLYGIMTGTAVVVLMLLSVIYFIAVVILVFRKSHPEENIHGKSALENPALFEYSGFAPVVLAIIFNSAVIYAVGTVPSNLEDKIIMQTTTKAEANWTVENTDLDLYVEKYFEKIEFIEDDEKLETAKRNLINKLSLKQEELQPKEQNEKETVE